jgi:hypothetical protein
MPKRLMVSVCLGIAALLMLSSIAPAQEAGTSTTAKTRTIKNNYFDVGIGVNFGSAYKDALTEDHADWDISGGGGWVYVDVGFVTKVAPRAYLGPRVGMLATFIEYQSIFAYSDLNSKQATIVILPGVTGKYDLTPKVSTPFIEADLSLVSTTSDLELPKLSSGGLAFGGTVGYSFSHKIEVAIAYRYVPVKVNDDETKNFGGVGLIVRTAFGF